IFLNKIEDGGRVIYNEEDKEVNRLILNSELNLEKIPYHTPEFTVVNGITSIKTDEGIIAVEIFGKHNLNNLEGARKVCEKMGVSASDFYKAIASFKGASKRLEKIAETKNAVAFKDYAHSPSKVKATTEAVKNQYPNRKLIACLELHTYSSLTPEFLKEYKNTLDAADTAVVYYSPHAVMIKQLEEIKQE